MSVSGTSCNWNSGAPDESCMAIDAANKGEPQTVLVCQLAKVACLNACCPVCGAQCSFPSCVLTLAQALTRTVRPNSAEAAIWVQATEEIEGQESYIQRRMNLTARQMPKVSDSDRPNRICHCNQPNALLHSVAILAAHFVVGEPQKRKKTSIGILLPIPVVSSCLVFRDCRQTKGRQ